tara:strand:+ start:256 stop:414 length:159 start_codon:yes stop_codon:yes gene_type:complete
MSNIEDILYEALKLGIRKKVIERVGKLQKQNPYSPLEDLYSEALQIEKKLNE